MKAKLQDYTINAVKTFTGREGQGFNCNLLYKGKKVCLVMDMANGGEYDYNWKDFKEPRVMITIHNWEYNQKSPDSVRLDPIRYKGTPMQKLFIEMTDKLPKIPSSFSKGEYMTQDAELIIAGMVDAWETEKYFKRVCKTKIVIITEDCKEGEFIAIPTKWLPELDKHLYIRYPNLTEIVNRRYV